VKQKSAAGWGKVLGDTDPAAKAVRSGWTGSASKQVSRSRGERSDQINVVNTAKASGISLKRIAARISD